MALGSTQLLTEMSHQEYLLGSKGGRCAGLTTWPVSNCQSTLHDTLNLLAPELFFFILAQPV